MLADNPSLTARLGDTPLIRQPTRYILDSSGRVPATARAFDPEMPGSAVLVTTSITPATHRKELAARGVEVLEIAASPDGRVSLPSLLDELGNRGVLNLLVEGGAATNGSFMDGGLVDRLWAFIAPVVVGGDSAPGPIGGMGVDRMSGAVRLTNVETEMLDGDMWIRGDIEVNTGEAG